jgi:GNAT superfamily N-acetyltransferase
VTRRAAPTARSTPAPSLRPVRPDELEACADVWRVGIDDYLGRLNQPALPTESAGVVRLYRHLQATDPDRFIVAVEPDPAGPGGKRIVGFASVVVRERLWFLSMLFVLPEAQGAGLGRALLDAVAPDPEVDTVRATATDTAQPISNALYASLGIVPRVPLLNLIGDARRPEAFGALPSGVAAVPFEDVAADTTGGDGSGHRRLADVVDALDREALGVAHPLDHRFLRQEGRRGWLYHGPDGGVLGYGYASEAGRLGPVAARDPALVAPIVGHLATAVVPRGAFALWLPGTADRTVVGALQAGFRLEPFPVLLCWDRPFVDLARYLPISPGLL